MAYNGMAMSGSGSPDFSRMTTDQMMEWIRSNYGDVGRVDANFEGEGFNGYTTASGMNMVPNGDGTFTARVTGAYDGGGDGGQYGSWQAKYDADGKLIGDPQWGQNDRSGSWLDQNGWMIPLAVAAWAASPLAAGAAAGGEISGSSMLPELIGSSMETGGGLLGAEAITAGGIPASAIPTFEALTPAMQAITSGLTPEALATVGAATGSAAGGLLDMISPRTLAQLAGGVAGAAASGSGSGVSTSRTTEPWEAAQPWLRSLLAQGPELQDWYQRNPTNAIQDRGRQNYLSGVDNFNTNTAPALMNWANGWMNGSNNYQPTGGNGLLNRLWAGGTGSPATSSTPSTGSNSIPGMMGVDYFSQGQNGELVRRGSFYDQPPMTAVMDSASYPGTTPATTTPRGPFSNATYTPHGTIDWRSMNPFSNGVRSLLNFMPTTGG